MDFSNEDRHRETIEVLNEALAYLERLPVVPATRHMSQKIREHLDQPMMRLIAQRKRELFGQRWLEAGLPLLEASIKSNMLTVGLDPELSARHQRMALDKLCEELKTQPIRIGLTARNSD